MGKYENTYFNHSILEKYLEEVGKEGLVMPHCVICDGTPMELDFYPTDSKSNWLEISKLKRFNTTIKRYHRTFKTNDVKELVEYYTKNPISYKINSLGFRDAELDTKENKDITVFLGCSFTFGNGLPEDKVWTRYVKEGLSFKNTINAATPGTGPLTHLRTLLYLLQNFDVKRVFYLYDFSSPRYEWDLGNIDAEYETWMFGEDPRYSLYGMKLLTSPRNAKFFDILCFSTFQKICDNYQVEFLYQPTLTYNDLLKSPKQYSTTDIWARDLMHTGFLSHKVMAEKFIEKYRVSVGTSNNSA